MELPKDEIIIASDVNKRDGIGVEIYRNNELLIEIFRDDSKRTRTVTFFKKDIDLELIEKSIIDWKETLLVMRNWCSVSYWKTNPIITNNKKIRKSMIRSATMVPKALSNGISSYFFIKTAREISPERGTVKLTK